MANVVGVRFRNAGKLYYFAPGEWQPAAGQAVIVETARGLEYGEVVTGVSDMPDENITPPLRPVIRIASQEDTAHHLDNVSKEKDAIRICKEKIADHQLQMKLVGCEYTFDNNKILFYFTADKRVDFRLLVKDLAGAFHTRIELRQIGVRDEARMMGGLGICGRPLCCSRFLGDFHSVSIKMAKEQNLSLNPTKISGACGRLMCCLQYEEEFYEKVSREMPRVGRGVHTPDGDGVVVDVSILKERVKVRLPKGSDEFEVKEYPAADVQRLSGPIRPVPRPEPADQEEDEPDPEIMHALRASEMEVPDVDNDVALPEDDVSETAAAGEEPSSRPVCPPRPRRAPRADEPRTDRDSRPGRSEGRQGGRRPRPADAAAKEDFRPAPRPPRARADAPAPKPDAAQASAPRRDPWTVPEEYRQKKPSVPSPSPETPAGQEG